MNPEIAQKLAKIAELTDAELHALHLSVTTELGNLGDDDSTQALGRLAALQNASDAISRAFASRERAALTASAAPGARRGKIASMARRQARAQPSPELGEPRTALVATGGISGALPGTNLDRESLAEAMCKTLSRMTPPSGSRGSRGKDVVIASASWADQYPDDRRAIGEFEHDQRMLAAHSGQDALVATGGICSPVNVDWSVGTIASADRPLRDALPANLVSRGGLIFRPDFDFSIASGAIGLWTEATDLSPAGATKPIAQIACPSTVTTYVEAVTNRLGFGNMQARFDPETIAAATSAAMAAQARVAENNLLNLIAAAATQNITNTQVLGATRDLFTAIAQAVAAYRSLHRVSDDQIIRVCLPAWGRFLIRADLARETAHQQDSSWNSLAISDEQIDSLFEPYGVSPIWHLDGQSAGNGVAVNQFFASQSSGAINPFPTKMTWYLWYEGAVQYLDGGMLDLGVVRDSMLDATNDFEVFTEQFESVAVRAFTGGVLQFNTTLCANGGSAATTAVGSCA